LSTSELMGYLASIAMGLVLGLTGGGGSLLALPILVYFFGISALAATSYSLGIIGVISLWGAFGAYRNGDLKLDHALFLGIPGIIGVILSRRLFLPMVPDPISLFSLAISKDSLLLISFALLMLFTSLSMLKSLAQKRSSASSHNTNPVAMSYLVVLGLLVGILSGFVGAGGGFLIVPALLSLGKLDMKRAVGTSLLIIGMQSVFGVLSDVSRLDILDLRLFLAIVSLASVGMSMGSRARSFISDTKLKAGFAVLVLVLAVGILWDQAGWV
jgi:uncharacterized membrane protein YfcA